MAKDLDAILDSPEAIPAKSCAGSDGHVSYLREIILPIYETMAAVGAFSWIINQKAFSIFHADAIL